MKLISCQIKSMQQPPLISGCSQIEMKGHVLEPTMINQQSWQTEEYKGMDVHVTALPHGKTSGRWDFTVRITDPGTDSSAASALAAASGDDEDYATEEAAVQAGFSKGYVLVDDLKR